MKKLFLSVIALLLITIACSKSDSNDEEEKLQLSYANLKGIWYFKESVLMDNSVVPYRKIACPAKRDYIIVNLSGEIKSVVYYNNCVPGDPYGCYGWGYNPGSDMMLNGNSYFTGRATITRTTFRVDYTDPTMTEPNGPDRIKAIVLTRN